MTNLINKENYMICPHCYQQIDSVYDTFNKSNIPADVQVKLSDIMLNFDFERVQGIMSELEWEWFEKGIPSIEDLKRKAYELLIDCYSRYEIGDTYTHCATGGLKAVYYESGDFSLEFILESFGTES